MAERETDSEKEEERDGQNHKGKTRKSQKDGKEDEGLLSEGRVSLEISLHDLCQNGLLTGKRQRQYINIFYYDKEAYIH